MRPATQLVRILWVLPSFALFAAGDALADGSCDGPDTRHTIMNARLWEGTGCSADTARIREGSAAWGGEVRVVEERYLTNDPEVTLSHLKVNTVGDRVPTACLPGR